MVEIVPVISVIIPLYNKGKYIARALDSVFSQSLQNFEIIVIDDGSTDNGPDIVRKYNDVRLRIIHQDNLGPGAARNRGIKESTATFLAFLDADDEWMPEFLEKSYSRLLNHPRCVLAACAYLVGPERINLGSVWRRAGILEGEWQLNRDAMLKVLKDAVNFLSSCSILCKREVVEQLGDFYEKNHCTYGEDAHFLLRAVLNRRIYRSLEPLVWKHTEASELGVSGRRTVCPPSPILTDPESVRLMCPSEFQPLLEKYLAYYALQTMHRHLAAGDFVTCSGFPQVYPLMKTWRWEYTKVRFKLMFPILVPFSRWLKEKVARKGLIFGFNSQNHDGEFCP